MNLNLENITFIIVTFNSEKVIYDCIDSLPKDSNKIIMNFIKRCFDEDVTKIIVITGKGLRSKNTLDPYISKDLGILKNSVPEFIRSNQNLMKMIIEIREAKIEDGGSGAFYIFLKNRLKNKF